MSSTRVTNTSAGIMAIPGMPVLAPGAAAIVAGTPDAVIALFGGFGSVGESLRFDDAGSQTPDAAPPGIPATATSAGSMSAAQAASLATLGGNAAPYVAHRQVTVTGATAADVLGAGVAYNPGAGIKAFLARAMVALLGTAGATTGKGGSFELEGAFAVAADGTITQESTTTTVHSKADAAFNAASLPSFAITGAAATSALDVLATNGAAGETNKWSVRLVIDAVAA